MIEIAARLTTALADRYAIQEELGAGGMATVYLAEDLKHHRQVAVKVLRPELAAILGAERFLKEIEVTANLQHPHILPLFDSGQVEGFLFYVMPFMGGESLRDRLNREKQLPIGEAISITGDVARALDHAHRHDVLHRDIKPENLLLREGQPMVADFGIALAVSAAGGQRITETGLSLGTPHYMSPEQAVADRELDARSDIYSLGCVLYEMLAGQPPHTGATGQAVLTKIVTEEPVPISKLRRSVPSELEEVVHQAIAKLPADRFSRASEFADALTAAGLSTRAAARPTAHPTPPKEKRAVWSGALARAPWVVAAAAVAFGVWSLGRGPESSSGGAVTRLVISLPAEEQLTGTASPPFAFSPDGKLLAYVSRGDALGQLYVRVLDDFGPRAIAGTEGANAPFFSPDGNWVGFFADGRLQKVSLAGGLPVTIADAPWSSVFSIGASWSEAGDIVLEFGHSAGLWRVDAEGGGTPEELTSPDTQNGEVGHGWPQILPNGEDVLFTVGTTSGTRRIAVLSLSTGEWRTVLDAGRGASGARYVVSGHLVFAQSGGLLAAPFDLRRLTSTGSGVSVVDRVYTYGAGLPYFSISESGSLAFAPGDEVQPENTLVWVDRTGNATPLTTDRGTYLYPRLSPDGRQVAFAIAQVGNRDIWIYDVMRGTRRRLTSEGINTDPVWTPDGRYITFASNRTGDFDLYRQAVDGSREAELLLARPNPQFPHAWSPDGNTLGFYELTPTGARDILMLEGEGDRTVSAVHMTPLNERSPTFSPNGKWMAYVSNGTGRDEVYVQRFPEGEHWSISSNGGTEPVWSADGRELFYRQGEERMMVVSVVTEPEFRAGRPELLFEGRYDIARIPGGDQNFDVSPDGRRFVMIQRNERSAPAQINLVLNWLDELRERVRTPGN